MTSFFLHIHLNLISTMAPTTGGSSLLTPDEEAMALLQSGPLSPDVPSEDDDDDCSSASTESTGKLKSDDDDDEIDDEPEPSSHRGPLRLRVKCSGGNLRPPPSSNKSASTAAPGAEYPLSASPAATVADLKASVRNAVLGPDEPDGGHDGNNGERYVRLIVRGRLLAPDAAPVSNFGLKDDDVVHAVVAAAGVRGGPQERLARGGGSFRYREREWGRDLELGQEEKQGQICEGRWDRRRGYNCEWRRRCQR